MKTNNKKQIQEIEAHAHAVLSSSGAKPLGSDRRPYKTVAYLAGGKYECETINGCRDYLSGWEILAWK